MEQWSLEEFKNKLKDEKTSSVCLEGIQCSSPEIMSQMVSTIADNVQYDDSLKVFRVKQLRERSNLESWPLYKLISKANNCQIVEISSLIQTTDQNR